MYQAKDYSHLLGTPGFSNQLLENHFKLYQGYVTNTNKVLEKLQALSLSGDMGPEYAEMKRRLGWEFGGMRLHELYFSNLTNGGKSFDDARALAKKIQEQYGSFDTWQKEFLGTGALRGIGWVVMVYDAEGDTLLTTWVNEHDLGHLVTTTPLLVMDVFEHAFVLDYGMNRAEYIATFMKNLDWSVVASRFDEIKK